MGSIIKHVLAVGLGEVKTNNKGKSLINDKLYRYNTDKSLPQTLKTHYLK